MGVNTVVLTFTFGTWSADVAAGGCSSSLDDSESEATRAGAGGVGGRCPASFASLIIFTS